MNLQRRQLKKPFYKSVKTTPIHFQYIHQVQVGSRNIQREEQNRTTAEKKHLNSVLLRASIKPQVAYFFNNPFKRFFFLITLVS